MYYRLAMNYAPDSLLLSAVEYGFKVRWREETERKRERERAREREKQCGAKRGTRSHTLLSLAVDCLAAKNEYLYCRKRQTCLLFYRSPGLMRRLTIPRML